MINWQNCGKGECWSWQIFYEEDEQGSLDDDYRPGTYEVQQFFDTLQKEEKYLMKR
jgi:hypothetical protein